MEGITKQYKISILNNIRRYKNADVFELSTHYGVKRNQCGLINEPWKHQILDKIKCALKEMRQDGFITYDEKGDNLFNFKLTNKGCTRLLWHKAQRILYWILFTIPVALGGWITIIATMKGFFDAK